MSAAILESESLPSESLKFKDRPCHPFVGGFLSLVQLGNSYNGISTRLCYTQIHYLARKFQSIELINIIFSRRVPMAIAAAKTLMDLLEFNQTTIHAQLKDITPAESLLQLPFRGNCMNWVVGHIVAIRQGWLEMLGLPGIMTEEEQKAYGYGSEPIGCAEQAIPLESLVKRLDENLAVLVKKLQGMTQSELDREVEIWRGKVPLAEALFFYLWHESYHTGQLEQLRQLAGKNDHVI
jgi:uncharacterized damage-inducible protein DinB